MGAEYSAEQKKEFETHRQLMEKAVKDKEPFADFKITKEALQKKIEAKIPLIKQEH